jgi:hypothetical protein
MIGGLLLAYIIVLFIKIISLLYHIFLRNLNFLLEILETFLDKKENVL